MSRPRSVAEKFLSLLLVVALALPLGLIRARAAEAAGSCSAAVTNGAFGSLDPTSGSYQTTATLNFSCTGLTPLTPVTLCPNLDGGSGGATTAARLLTAGGGTALAYQIYQDAARSIPWGSSTFLNFGAAPTVTATTSASGAVGTSRTLYLNLPEQSAVAPGTYASTFGGETFIWGLNILSCAGVTVGSTLTPAPFTISAVVPASCSLTAVPISFGTITSLSAPLSASGALSVTCTPASPYTVALSNGQTGSGPTTRLMTFGSNAVTYGLYSDSACGHPWGNDSGQTVSGSGLGIAQALPVYACTPAQSTPPAGSYADVVVATVTY